MRLIPICLLVFFCITKGSFAQRPDEVVGWINETAYDLVTTNPDQSIRTDSLAKTFKDIDIVLAGEANHGTKEFAEIKHRLFRHLVENLGFTYFLVEADFAACLNVDNYICNGIGDPIDVIKTLGYYHIVNNEGLQMIRWMREYNQGKNEAEQIRFFGIDCQSSQESLRLLRTFFARVDPSFYKKISGSSLVFEPSNSDSGLDLKSGQHILDKASINLLLTQLMSHQTRYQAASSDKEFKIALRLVESLRQSNEIYHSTYGYAQRDAFMAANVAWILDEVPDNKTRAYIWVHNTHASYGRMTVGGTNLEFGTLGRLLKDKYGDRVYSIGLTFNTGSFIASRLRQDTVVKEEVEVTPAEQDTFSSLLAQTGKEVLFLDFRSAADHFIINWLKGNTVKIRSSGARFSPSYQYRRHILPESFDGLIFINTVHAVTLHLE